MKTLIISDNKKFAKSIVNLLIHTFNPCPEIMVTGCKTGRRDVMILHPRLIILDIDTKTYDDMADYLVRLVPKYSVPVIVCTEQSRMKYTFVNAGAVDVIRKQHSGDAPDYFANRLSESISTIQKAVSEDRIRSFTESTKIIAIGGSTGSTNALPVILNGLCLDAPPVICVLHMPEVYTKIYAQQLDNSLPFDVHEAKKGMYVNSGQVIIAAGAKHLRVFRDKKGYFITSEPGVKVSGHCPSVDVLFDSVAYAAKSDAIGVILTGMGSDGAKGMLNMKRMGAYNIGQDEPSSVVYGMPKTAFENGAVSLQSPLQNIAEDINRYLKLKASPHQNHIKTV